MFRYFIVLIVLIMVLTESFSAEPEYNVLAPKNLSRNPLEFSFSTFDPEDFSLLKPEIVNKIHVGDNYESVINIKFNHQRPGFLFEILDAVYPETNNNNSGNIKWHEMRKKDGFYEFRLCVETFTENEIAEILQRIRNIKDYINPFYSDMSRFGRYKAVLDVDIPSSNGNLKKIALFLRNHHIDVDSFVSPVTLDNTASIVMEINVSSALDFKWLEETLNDFSIEEFDSILKLKIGRITELLLDESIMPIIYNKVSLDPDFNTEEHKYADRIKILRHSIHRALSVVAEKHLSELRKDHKNPYITHQVEIIDILVNELNILNSSFINKFSREFKVHSLSKAMSLVLQTALLHDALEDGDISKKKLKQHFELIVYQMVNILTNKKETGTIEEEEKYLENITSDSSFLYVIAQIIKIADRIQNLRTLEDNSAAFQRRMFFKTWLSFIPYFLETLDIEKIKDQEIRDLLENAKNLFEDEFLKVGQKFGFIDQSGKINQQTLKQYKKEKEIIDQIKSSDNQRITFPEYMDKVLYEEGGFYAEEVSIGQHDASFSTYSEDKHFAYALAAQISEMYRIMNKPGKFSIVEMGAGSGSLAVNIIKAVEEKDPELFKALDYNIVEISPKLIRDQKASFAKEFSEYKKIPVNWIEGSAATELKKLNKIKGVFISNELVDQFPVHRLKYEDGKFKEVYVTFKNGRFTDESGPLSSQALADYVDNLGVEIKDGAEIPVNLIMQQWQKEIARYLKKGFVITIDYGGKATGISRSNPFAVWNRDTDSIDEIYNMTAECDITSEVNFFDLARFGELYKLKTEGYTYQRDFLWNLGIEEIEIDGKEIPDSISYDIATNFNFKVLIQSKGFKDSPFLTGLATDNNPYKYFFNKKIDVALPYNHKNNESVVITDINTDISEDYFREGRSGIYRFISEKESGYDPFKIKTEVESVSYVDQYGDIIISVKPTDLQRLKVYNLSGNILFDGGEFFKSERTNKLSFLFTEKEFKEEFQKTIDINNENSARLPKLLKFTPDGDIIIPEEEVSYKRTLRFSLRDFQLLQNCKCSV